MVLLHWARFWARVEMIDLMNQPLGFFLGLRFDSRTRSATDAGSNSFRRQRASVILYSNPKS